ncbi:LytR/AlgR family response regulator transcription factor [Solitalea canadensis]|uniref:Response regulator of the LytR/AlgR family n=1 Tax=Solitalea canadensis (strain ATCC 29591 / DSM 3403 / JCM 21819 / LMG 8368 / NBRC 15130 / NCIMB 12057 / USAM 9D) TaxID=929556 RepID=H8KWE0_SOLCM|nr:LytTR family DNA-binding domain-containing protein [Solitalea canadensis]AFD07932.1 response regulator of the LytR/AlgR family [Solitalea canadensis DSM 3403]
MNCIAVDDEPLALELLADNIAKIPFLNLIATCRNPFEAMEVLNNEQVDLIFMDIQMPGLTGVQFLQSTSISPLVIFITAYEKYALEGYSLNVVDYLLKPVAFDRFLKAVNKAYDLFNLKNKNNAAITSPPDYLFINSEYNLVKVNLGDILYVEGLKDYVKIFISKQERPILSRMNIKAIEEKLPTGKFIRVHKSFIISTNKIDSIRKNRIRIGEAEIPLSDNFKDELMKYIHPDKS